MKWLTLSVEEKISVPSQH